MSVLTKDSLEQLLSTMGVHSEDIEIAISEASSTGTSTSLVTLQAIANKAIANTSRRLEQSTDENHLAIWPPSTMKSRWRPKEDTIEMLVLLYPECDRVDIGFIREEFKAEYLGKVKRHWDALFFRFVAQRMYAAQQQSVSPEEPVTHIKTETPQSETVSPAELARRAQNKRVLNYLASSLAREKSASRSFRYIPTENWRPHKHTVEALQKKGVNKNFLLDPMILKPFITFYTRNVTFNVTLDRRYYQWVLKKWEFFDKRIAQEIEAAKKRAGEG